MKIRIVILRGKAVSFCGAGWVFSFFRKPLLHFLFPFATTRSISSKNSISQNSGMQFITLISKNFDESSKWPYICARCWCKISKLVSIMLFFSNSKLREVLISILALITDRKRVVMSVHNRMKKTQSSMSFCGACHFVGHPPVIWRH